MKHCFQKLFAPMIIAAGISACSVPELSGPPEPKLDGGFTSSCTVTAGIVPPGEDSGGEVSFVFSGNLKRLGAGFWEMEMTSPETVAGIKLSSCDGDLSSDLGELSTAVGSGNVSDSSPVYALFTALDKIAGEFENGAVLSSGEEGGWVYNCDGISAVFDGEGVITSLAAASPKMTAEFTGFCVTVSSGSETASETASECVSETASECISETVTTAASETSAVTSAVTAVTETTEISDVSKVTSETVCVME